MPQKETKENNIYLVQKTNDTCRTEDCGDPRPEMSDMDIDIEAHTKNWKIDIVSIT